MEVFPPPHTGQELGSFDTDQLVLELQDQVHGLHLRVLLDSLLQVLQTRTKAVRPPERQQQPPTRLLTSSHRASR